jgi:YidC/Oxa1 family membrane protein insertase
MRQEFRFLLAITLMILVLITTNVLFPPAPPEEGIAPDAEVPGQLDGSGDAVAPSIPLGGPTAGPGAAADPPDAFVGGPAVGPSPFDRPAPAAATLEDTVVVEGPLYRFAWSTAGARLISAQLLQFRSFDQGEEGDADQEKVVELIVPETGGALAMQLRVDEGGLDLGAEMFEVEPADGLRLAEGGGPQTLTFRYRHPSGALTLETAYTFDPSSYAMDVRTEVLGADGALLVTSMGSGLNYNERNRGEESRIMGYVTNHLGEGIDDEELSRVDSERAQEGPLLWAALKSKYFIFALVPGRKGSEQYLGGLIASPAPGEDQAAIDVTQSVGASGTLEYRIFLGPQERDRLVAFDSDLEEANPYGYRWMRPVVRPVVEVVLAILNFLHANLNVGYGWVLIIFGVMMRVLTFPLNQKAMRAQMRNMAVQPLLQEIQKKYKEQPEKLQKEMMKLYKDHGFNPLAGCLPMLLPWPVLITLFFVFRNTIQLRGESFLWLPNLAAADPLYILPIVLGLSMFFMQWITVRSMPEPNPQMKMMMWIMPIMMTVIFFNFASGLNLYYATSNLATIPQQYLIAKERQQLREKTPVPQPATSGD